MELRDIGQVIASRTLELRDGGVVTVQLGMPQSFPSGARDFFCPFRITGLGAEKISYAVGVDAFQAIDLTLKKIGTLLYTATEYANGSLLWLGGVDLGFPVPSSIRDILPD